MKSIAWQAGCLLWLGMAVWQLYSGFFRGRLCILRKSVYRYGGARTYLSGRSGTQRDDSARAPTRASFSGMLVPVITMPIPPLTDSRTRTSVERVAVIMAMCC